MGDERRTTLTTAGVRIPAVGGAPGSLLARLVSLVVAGTMVIVFGVVAAVSPAGAAPGNLVMVTGDGGFGVPSDAAKRTIFEGFGWTVTALDDDSSAAAYAAAAAANDVMYFSDSTGTGSFAVRDLDIGLVFDRYGVWGNVLYGTDQSVFDIDTTVELVDTSHYITAPLSAGSLAIYGAPDDVNGWNSAAGVLPAGVRNLAESSTNSSHDTLLVAETGADLFSGQTAPNRRVFLASDNTDPTGWTADYRTIVERSLDWASGQVGTVGTVVVNSTGDAADALPGDGICDTGLQNADTEDECTLRAAIQETNASGTLDTIHFDIPIGDGGHTAGTWTIALATELPTTTVPVTIDGTSHPDFVSSPVVALDGGGTALHGLEVDGGASAVRGLSIHSFVQEGIDIQVAGGNTIVGNWIGLLPDGTTAAANGDDGIAVRTDGNTIGGPAAADRNVVSANGGEGILVSGDSNTVEGNYLGTDATGLVDLGNGDDGLDLNGATGTIVRNNVISGNDGEGMQILGSDNGVITANLIGVGADGVTPVGNSGDGITVNFGDSVNVMIGGTGAGDGNTIAHNGDEGVSIFGATTDDIASLGNSIHSNGSLGWDFEGSGVTPNDVGDVDGGVNDLMNFPEIVSLASTAGTVDVDVDLDLTAGTYRIEFFDNPGGADPSGYGEGQTFVAAVTIVHAGAGIQRFDHSWTGSVSVLTATVTEDFGGGAYGSTSEYSAAFVANAPVAVDDPGDVPTATAERSPLGVFRLGEASGSIAAGGGSIGASGTYVGGVTLGVPGALAGDIDTAADFDGIDDYVEIPHDPAYLIDQGAVSLWIRPDTIGVVQSPISKDSNLTDDGGHLLIEARPGGEVRFRLQDTSVSYQASSPTGLIGVGTWHHVVATFGGRGMEVWVDGELVATDTYTGGLGTSSGGSGNAEPWVIGAGTDTSGDLVATPIVRPFDGHIDEVAIFPDQLDRADVRALYGAALQSYDAVSGVSLAVSAADGVLANDSDPDSGSLTASLVGAPVNAAAFAFNPDGSFSYESNPGFVGTDTFTYRANDGSFDSLPATVTITVIDASIVTVNATDDAGDAAPGDGVCDTGLENSVGGDACTLRAALEEANASAVVNTIHFDIPDADPNHNAGVWTIAPTSMYDWVAASVDIDATTQTGYVSSPLIVLDGTFATGGYVAGLGFTGAGADSRVAGLSIHSFADDGISSDVDRLLVEDNYLGVQPDGLTAPGSGAENVTLWGGIDSVVTNNLIAGSDVVANVAVSGAGTSATISDNTIGTDVTGALVLGGGQGVWTDATGGVLISGNTIAHTDFQGVQVAGSASSVSILGNEIRDNGMIGIDLQVVGDSGDLVTANDTGDGDAGPNGALNHPVVTSATEAAGTVTVDVELDVPAGAYRIELFTNPSGSDPSGYGEGELFVAATTVAHAGAGPEAFELTYSGAIGDVVTSTATEDFGGGTFGSTSEFSRAEAVAGGTAVVANSTGDAADLAPGDGVCDTGAANSEGADECTLRAAIEEANASATVDTIVFAIPNSDPNHRYHRDDATADSLGAPVATTLDDASITDFDPDYPVDPFSWWNIEVTGNLPDIVGAVTIDGTTQPGWRANTATGGAPRDTILPIVITSDGGYIMNVEGSGVTIRGLNLSAASGGSGSGTMIYLDGAGHTVDGSWFMVDPVGVANGSGDDGIWVVTLSSDIAVGGPDPADHILIGNGFSNSGLTVISDGATVENVWIGSTVTGDALLPGYNDIPFYVSGNDNVVRDIVVSSSLNDILIVQGDRNIVQGSSFGLLPDGTISNAEWADIDGNDNLIGGVGPGEGNAFGAGADSFPAAVFVSGGTGNSLLGNTYIGALDTPIDIAPNGVNPNDAGDVDAGDNDLLNHPVITVVTPSGATATVDYELDVPAGDYRIEFYADDAEPRNPSGYGAGEVLVGVDAITHTGSGVETFQATVSDLGDYWLGATATEDLGAGDFGSTSEFGPTVCVGDTDGDGLCDGWEMLFGDTDDDTFPNWNDADDDGDGIPTVSENADPNGDGDPRDALDVDRDREPDYLDSPTTPAIGVVADDRKISADSGGLAGPLALNDGFGDDIAAIGDIDGDGVVDLAVGAPSDDGAGTNRGAVYILFMNADGTVRDEQEISSSAGGLIAAIDDSDAFGSSVVGLGDLDGDGVGDIVVGAPGDGDGGTQRGAAYVLFLDTDGTVRGEQKISSTIGGLAPLADGDAFGESVASIDDLDGDGVGDLVVGARLDDVGGAVHVLFLRSDGTVRAQQEISASAGGLAASLGTADQFGSDVDGLGDVDGDGLSDIVVAAGNNDAAYVLFLRADGTVRAEQMISPTDGGFSSAVDADADFGSAIAGSGDIDGDGTPDLVVGAAGQDDGGTDRGAVYVVFLESDGTVRSDAPISSTRGGFSGAVGDGDRFGSGLAGLGDLDGDGRIDLAVGAVLDDDGTINAGAVYILDLAPPAPTLVVNSTGDDGDANPGDGICETATVGECTLRAAIEESNALASGAAVTFAIPQTDPGYDAVTDSFTIAPGSLYPSITRPIRLDGSTQPEAGALPAIVIDGSIVTDQNDIVLHLTTGSDRSAIHALTIHSASGHAIKAELSDDHTLTGLVLGLEADGITAAGNRYGIYTDDAQRVTIGGDTAVERNVISANDWGIAIYEGSESATITGNYVGTDHTGLLDRGNVNAGVFVVNGSSYARVGGPAVGEANVVAGNGGDGIYIGSGALLDPVVEGNLVGVGADGSTPIPNGQDGIHLGWGSGGSLLDNAIGPQGENGIRIESHDNAIVQGNIVGTDAAQLTAWTLGHWAVYVAPFVDDALIGGAGVGEANIFRNGTLGGIGVAPTAGTGNSFLSNVNADHAGPAIDLGADGVTPNDAGDPDVGPNDLVNRPVLHGATEIAGTVQVDVLLDLPAGSYRVELFDATDEDPFGGGGGHGLVHTFDVVHGGAGVQTFTTSFSGSDGDQLVATVTEGSGPFGSTSEYSYRTTVVGPDTIVVNSTDDDVDALAGDGVCGTGQINSLGAPECTVRAAIEEANANGTSTAIHFEIPDTEGGFDVGSGSWAIAPAVLPLPAITSPGLDIDARTQPTWLSDPVIELDGSSPGLDPSADGIGPDGDGIVIRGWSITNWPDDGAYTARDDVVFSSNWFGVDPSGSPAPNASSDLVIYNAATDVVVGGATPSLGNVFGAGGSTDAIWVMLNASGTEIRNNHFGLGADGVTALGAAGEAINVLNNTSSTLIADNRFGYLPNAAIVLQDAATDTVITGNIFGLDANGDPAPVDMALWTNSTASTRFGGTAVGDGNTVANVADVGVVNAELPGDVTILGNSFVDGASIAIDIAWDGRTTNDSPDADGVVNHPVLTDITAAASVLTVDVALDVPAGDYRIEFFANPSGADPTGFGEGEIFRHAETVTHGGTGVETFSTSFAGVAGDVITATATEAPVGGFAATSEFSNAFTAVSLTIATVNSTGDAGDANPGDGACATATPGECTLRAAVEEANASADIDTIEFDIPVGDPGHTAGVWTITPATALPTLAGPLTLDADTQPGAACAADGQHTIAIQLDGARLDVSGSGTTISGIAVDGVTGTALTLTGDANRVRCSYLGLGADGVTASGLVGTGVSVDGDDNVIGGSSDADRNVISTGGDTGVDIGTGSSRTLIERNHIGTDVTGTVVVSNFSSGVSLTSDIDTTIRNNLVSGNWDAVFANGSAGLVIESNRIGTDAAGTSALGNGGNGIWLLSAATDVAVTDNVISGSGSYGVLTSSSVGTIAITGNIVGLDAAGSAAIPNGDGLYLQSPTVVGGPGATDGNTISGNAGDGITFSPGTAAGSSLVGNHIGTDVAGTVGIGNGGVGVLIWDADDVTIGGTGLTDGNVIAGNTGHGIEVRRPARAEVRGNRIGIGADGSPIGNGGDGISVTSNAVDTSILDNEIAHNGGLGIDLDDDGVTPNDAGDADTGANDLLNTVTITGGSELLPGLIGVNYELDVPANTDGYRLEFFANPTGVDASGHGEGEVFIGSTVVSGSGLGVFQYTGSLGDAVSATATEIDGFGFGATSEFSLTFLVTGDDTVVVNATGDGADANPGNGVCETATAGECTLRAAIEEANATAGIDTIEFDIPVADPGHSAGVWTIAPATALPNITETVSIDGSTQAGWVPNTAPAPLPLNGSPVVELIGSWNIGDGLNVAPSATGTTIHGLVIGGFDGPDDYGVQVDADDVTITGSYIGVRADGVTDGPSAYGIVVDAARTTIGGVDPSDRNVVAGTQNAQILLNTGVDTVILGNVIGADAGTSTVVGTWGSGIQAWSGSGLVLGSNAAPNVIGAAPGDWGIELNISAVIESNLFGTDATYTADLGGWAAIQSDNGIPVIIRDNVVGNWDEGLIIEGDDTIVVGNFIGTDPSGSIDLGNATTAVQVGGSFDAPTGVVIGGPDVGDGNVIAFNDPAAGVVVEGAGTRATIIGNSIRGNAGLGIDLGGDGLTPNDTDDIDAGANGLLNTPELRSAAASGDAVDVDYSFDAPAGTYRIEIFDNPSGIDPSGYGEGERLAGIDTIVHPGGDGFYTVTIAGAVGDALSATATEDLGAGSFGATSEFSAARTVTSDGVVVLDRSVQRSDLVTSGGLGAAVDGAGLVAASLDFAGGTDRLIGPPTEIGSSSLTLSGWVFAGNLPNDATIVSKRPIGGGAIYELSVDAATGEAVARIEVGATIEARGGSVTTGAWHQLAATWDGSDLRVYVDGTEVASTSAVGSLGSDVSAPIVVGNDAVGSAGVDGGLDQIEIAHVARSAEWIETAYNNLTSPGMVTIGAAETGTPGAWTTSTAIIRNGTHALSAPETVAGADAWAVATGIDEPGLAFESWWYLTDPGSTVAAAGTNTGDAATDQREVAVGPGGLALGAIDGAATTTDATDPSTVALGTWTRVEIRTDELGNSSVWLDGVEIIPAVAHSGGTTGGSAGLRTGQLPASEQWYVDDVRIRRYVSDEPVTTLGPIDRR